LEDNLQALQQERVHLTQIYEADPTSMERGDPLGCNPMFTGGVNATHPEIDPLHDQTISPQPKAEPLDDDYSLNLRQQYENNDYISSHFEVYSVSP
jgi:hypothetical protein